MNILKHTTFNIVFFMMLFFALPALAGPKLEFGDNKWLSIGAGARVHFFTQEDGAADGESWSNSFGLENMRLYVNGQIHKYMKIEFNTDCTDCLGTNSKGTMIVLDAIGKFEFNQYINIWAGRQLVPSDRAELDGPYFQNTFDFNKTPFYPSDFGNFVAGRFGRDDGVNLWGAFFEDKRLTYVVGVFDGVDHSGLAGRPNTGDNLLWAGRVSYNFLGRGKESRLLHQQHLLRQRRGHPDPVFCHTTPRRWGRDESQSIGFHRLQHGPPHGKGSAEQRGPDSGRGI